jgi:hypothetical protein
MIKFIIALLFVPTLALAKPDCRRLPDLSWECHYYGVIKDGAPQDTVKSHGYLMPIVGDMRPLKIVSAWVHSNQQQPTAGSIGRHVLLILPPTNSGAYWKHPLARSYEGQGTWDRQAFNPPIHLFPEDALCLQNYSKHGASYGIMYLVGP